MLSSLAPARRRLVVALAVLVLAAVVAVVVAVVTSGDDADRGPTDQGDAGPVVLVPGYGGSTTGLNALATVLRHHGRDATVVQLPGDGRGDLDAQAETVGHAVDAVRHRTRAATVDLVGYSAGGVVARLWIGRHGGAEHTRRVLTLGSPQHGTDLASFAGSAVPGACPTACRQLATDSALLAGLNAHDETPAGPTWVSVWTTHDDVVIPPDSARLDGATNLTVQSVCPSDTVRHSGLPTDTDVQSIALAVLASGAVPELTRSDCGRPTVSS